MPDTLVAKGSDAKFKSHPEGQYVAQCVDAIDLGERVEEFAGKPKRLVHKCAMVFRTGEKNEDTGDFIDLSREFTVSMGDLANLRKFLEQWRGKPYTADQIAAGVPLHKLAGNYGLLTVAQKTSGNGRVYANITACVGVPRQMAKELPSHVEGYTRAAWWQERKDAYAAEAKQFRAEHAAPSDDDYPAPDADELPF